MGLDGGLLEATIQYLENNHELVHIGEIYGFLEGNYNFSDEQKAIHKQMLGQEEPNWMHDLRNLKSKERGKKGGGRIINPKINYWGLTRNRINIDVELLFDLTVKEADIFARKKERLPFHRIAKGWFVVVSSSFSNGIIIENNNGKRITLGKNMFCKHLQHLLDCGGSLDVGKLHRYKNKESAMIHLCPMIDTESELIILRDTK